MSDGGYGPRDIHLTPLVWVQVVMLEDGVKIDRETDKNQNRQDTLDLFASAEIRRNHRKKEKVCETG